MNCKNDIRKFVKSEFESIFQEVAAGFDLECGDISPDQTFALNRLEEKLTDLLEDYVEQNLDFPKIELTRDATPHGCNIPVYGYIKGNEFIFVEYKAKIKLEGGDVVESYSLQTGGMCMVDYVEMSDGSVYNITDECFCRFLSKQDFENYYENDDPSYCELVSSGKIEEFAIEMVKRKEKGVKKHEERYQIIRQANKNG